ncbi:LOW QUALITY PROTEIN: hypothetical protein M8C21_014368 [Ambrosia artemisiifolia]|uniref:Uncharacterized protein n=1 Tax=Ambrosia artemisiifolia TaxID=4212 RepID=A0AAD5GTK3_AMBAR|nr:LOW QUALITY PROTEIN: hypothetical protein M8C21_014368 [Ambrosia artemisiifolia]
MKITIKYVPIHYSISKTGNKLEVSAGLFQVRVRFFMNPIVIGVAMTIGERRKMDGDEDVSHGLRPALPVPTTREKERSKSCSFSGREIYDGGCHGLSTEAWVFRDQVNITQIWSMRMCTGRTTNETITRGKVRVLHMLAKEYADFILVLFMILQENQCLEEVWLTVAKDGVSKEGPYLTEHLCRSERFYSADKSHQYLKARRCPVIWVGSREQSRKESEGAMKRWGFKGWPAPHATYLSHRSPDSLEMLMVSFHSHLLRLAEDQMKKKERRNVDIFYKLFGIFNLHMHCPILQAEKATRQECAFDLTHKLFGYQTLEMDKLDPLAGQDELTDYNSWYSPFCACLTTSRVVLYKCSKIIVYKFNINKMYFCIHQGETCVCTLNFSQPQQCTTQLDANLKGSILFSLSYAPQNVMQLVCREAQ